MVLLLRGDLFWPEDLRRIASSFDGILALWAIDSVYRMRKGLELCRDADVVFLYNKEEADDCTHHGKPVFYLPLGYDDRFYRPLAVEEKEIDLYYVGTFHPDRKIILNEILGAIEGQGFRVVVDGKIVPGRRPFMKKRLFEDYPHLLRVATNRAVDHAHINTMTNKAKVCLNILPDHAFSGLNTRAFEICGAGGFQLVSHNSGLEYFFDVGGEIVSYRDTTELVARLRHYLDAKNEKERIRIAAQGHARARMAHRFESRVSEFLERVSSA
jgi:spore maturation protein CgeB